MHFHTSPAGRHIDSTSHRLVGKGVSVLSCIHIIQNLPCLPRLQSMKTENLTTPYGAVTELIRYSVFKYPYAHRRTSSQYIGSCSRDPLYMCVDNRSKRGTRKRPERPVVHPIGSRLRYGSSPHYPTLKTPQSQSDILYGAKVYVVQRRLPSRVTLPSSTRTWSSRCMVFSLTPRIVVEISFIYAPGFPLRISRM